MGSGGDGVLDLSGVDPRGIVGPALLTALLIATDRAFVDAATSGRPDMMSAAQGAAALAAYLALRERSLGPLYSPVKCLWRLPCLRIRIGDPWLDLAFSFWPCVRFPAAPAASAARSSPLHCGIRALGAVHQPIRRRFGPVRNERSRSGSRVPFADHANGPQIGFAFSSECTCRPATQSAPRQRPDSDPLCI